MHVPSLVPLAIAIFETVPNQIIHCRVEHSARGEAAFVLTDPRRQLEAWEPSQVSQVLGEAAAAAEQGCFVLGFVSYDAAPTFDPAFRVPSDTSYPRSDRTLPLAWFGVFSSFEALAPQQHTREPLLSPRATEPKPWTCVTDSRRYSDSVEHIINAIAQGDTYLTNYTTRFRRTWDSDESVVDLYEQVIGNYNGGYHALIETTDWAVLCGSPELFFELSDGQLTTRPMKGTAPRGRWAEEDLLLATDLVRSEKEQAENVMVVDMMRNDLGRITTTGSVSVASLFDLEQHPSLWQMTSTVTGSLREDLGVLEVFQALFPGASVTGAPKIAAMAKIAELEDTPRGLYCGALGYMGPDLAGRDQIVARFAVAIRTAVVDKQSNTAEYGSGGGITSGSEPLREWEEVLVKARAVLQPPSSQVAYASLIETMGFEPNAQGGVIRNLSEHLDRLTASAAYLGFPEPLALTTTLMEAVHGQAQPLRVRLEYSRDGSVSIKTSRLERACTELLQRLCVDDHLVDPTDIRLFHKTSSREIYDERIQRHRHADDVILVNQRGELTETTRANIAVLLEGQWCTPPLTAGLLPGIERARLITDGSLVERIIMLEDLEYAQGVATMSSLRGWRPSQIIAPHRCAALHQSKV